MGLYEGFELLRMLSDVACCARINSPAKNRYDVTAPSPMAHLVALHGCRILANMACDGEALGIRMHAPTHPPYCTVVVVSFSTWPTWEGRLSALRVPTKYVVIVT